LSTRLNPSFCCKEDVCYLKTQYLNVSLHIYLDTLMLVGVDTDLLRNIKALSPVIAAVILIGATVAVSVAVGAWMGAFTFQNMKTEELKIITHRWGTNNADITLTVKATGTAAQTINRVLVNDQPANMTPSTITLQPGDSTDIVISGLVFESGTKYEFQLLTTSGYKFAYTTTAP